MKKFILLGLFLMTIFSASFAHTEIFAHLSYTNYNNELFIRATLDKEPLVHALKKEGDCSAKTMLKECGDKFLKTYIKTKVNNKLVDLHRVGFEIEKDQIIFSYEVKNTSKIESISVESEYMLKYNPHGGIKVFFEINEHKSSYTMTERRKKITANF